MTAYRNLKSKIFGLSHFLIKSKLLHSAIAKKHPTLIPHLKTTACITRIYMVGDQKDVVLC